MGQHPDPDHFDLAHRQSASLLDDKRKQVEEALRRAYDDLEIRVAQRTAELSRVNGILKAEVIEHKKSELARGRFAAGTCDSARRGTAPHIAGIARPDGPASQRLNAWAQESGQVVRKRVIPHTGSFHRLQELTEQLMEKTHNLAWELRPASLDDLGLQTALSNYVEKWSQRSGIRADFHSQGLARERLPPPIETAVYRIVQEALNNILKTAGANRVSVILEFRDNQLRAIVEDDGQGFDSEAVRFAPGEGHGLGLLGIRSASL